MNAIPTKHVAVQLKFEDESVLNLANVEFFSKARMIWIRNCDFPYEGLREAIIEGAKFYVSSVENLGKVLEVKFEH